MNRRADASCFGLDFQANAAILLTLENMRILDYVRLESDEDFLSKITEPLNANSFRIQVFSFETDMEDERYKVVLDKIRDFTSSMRLHSLEPARLMKIWQRDFFVNASKHDSYIMLKKKDVIWPILVIITDIDGIQESMEDALDMDQGEYEEVIYHYRDLINVQCERFRSFTRVITDYSFF